MRSKCGNILMGLSVHHCTSICLFLCQAVPPVFFIRVGQHSATYRQYSVLKARRVQGKRLRRCFAAQGALLPYDESACEAVVW